MHFVKYQAIGNDYLVRVHNTQAYESQPNATLTADLNRAAIQRICDRHRGIGADGILLPEVTAGKFAVRIFNPDGSEAEKSGNGLRIFARWLFDIGLVGFAPFEVDTRGGRVRCQLLPSVPIQVQVDMGQVQFEQLHAPLQVDDTTLVVHIASIGNPHCVLIEPPESTRDLRRLAHQLGPHIETHARFPNRTNVQFARVLDRGQLQLEIWERGAGYTLASGSSSCAAVAVAVRLGLCEPDVTVHMPGGDLHIHISPGFHARMTGPVVRVADVEMNAEALAA